jgi:hypothetical protein
VEAHRDFGGADGDGGWHVDQIAKEVTGLGISIAAHFLGQLPVCEQCCSRSSSNS